MASQFFFPFSYFSLTVTSTGRSISRHGPDTSHTSAFVNSLSNFLIASQGQPLAVFYDVKSLEDGEQFDVAFMKAMCQTLVVTPFVTAEALKRMCAQNSLREVDNLLLEWWLALCLFHSKQGKVRAILPVFCGEVSHVSGSSVHNTLIPG